MITKRLTLSRWRSVEQLHYFSQEFLTLYLMDLKQCS